MTRRAHLRTADEYLRRATFITGSIAALVVAACFALLFLMGN